MSSIDQRYFDLVQSWRESPRKFDADLLGVTGRADDPLRWDKWEPEADRLYLAHDRLAIKSARGIGKTFHWGPRRALHFLICYPPCMVIVTGPGHGVAQAMMNHIVDAWFPRLHDSIRSAFRVVGGEIVFARNRALGRIVSQTCDSTKRVALKRARSHNVLVIGDEWSGADDESHRMMLGYLSTNGVNRMALFSQPTRNTGPFYRECTAPSSRFAVLTVPGNKSRRVNKQLRIDLAASYGEDSEVYRSDWLAEFPSEHREAFIKQTLIRAAIGREVPPQNVLPMWGLDPSGVGPDQCPLAMRRGQKLEPLVLFGGVGKRPEETAEEIIAFWIARPEHEKPHTVNVDAGGEIGTKICGILERAGMPIRRRFLGVPALRHQFVSSKTEAWWNMREWLETASLPDQPWLVEQLSTPALGSVGNGQVKLEDNDEVRKRGAKSPDGADAVALSLIKDGLGIPRKAAA